MCSFELFVYLNSYTLVLSVRLSGTVGFFLIVVFTNFYSVFVFVLYYVLPEWRNNQLLFKGRCVQRQVQCIVASLFTLLLY